MEQGVCLYEIISKHNQLKKMEQQNNLKNTMLVKALALNSNEWVEGYYFNNNGKDYIMDNNGISIAHPINPDTFCRFTGIYCSETKKPIFEGDNVNGNLFVKDTFGALHWNQCSLFAISSNSEDCIKVEEYKLNSYNFTLKGGNIYDPKPNNQDF